MAAGNSITPGRLTQVLIDTAVKRACQPAFWFDVKDEKVGDASKSTDVKYWKDIGWRVAAYQDEMNVLHETATADGSVMTFTTPGAFGTLGIQRTPSELSGIGSTTTRSSGDLFYQKQIADGSSWASNDSSDQSSFPGPNYTQPVALDRVAKTSSDTRPDDWIVFRFQLPTLPSNRSIGQIIGIYFTGIPSQTQADASPGKGQYHLLLYGDGMAYLYEQTGTTGSSWVLRSKMVWAQPHDVAGKAHVVRIGSDAWVDGDGNWYGSKIIFQFLGVSGALGNYVNNFIDIVQGNLTVYNIPKATPTSTPQPTLSKLRVDCRRTVRLAFQASKHLYKDSGALKTPIFTLPYNPKDFDGSGSVSVPFEVGFWGVFPTGTSAVITMYNAAGSALTATDSTTTGANYAYRHFAVPSSDTQQYYAQIVLSSDSGHSYSPTISRFTCTREAVSVATGPTPVTPDKTLFLSISGGSMDPSTETVSVKMADLSNGLSVLQTRGEVCFQIRALNSSDNSLLSVLHSGRLAEPVFKRIGNHGIKGFSGAANTYPYATWGIYDCKGTGEWSTLMRAKLPRLWDFSVDPSATLHPYKVTDVIRILLKEVGYPAYMIDVPDLSPRLFVGPSDKQGFVVESFTEIGPIIVDLARTYLGAYLVYDANATNGGGSSDTYGCWRIRRPAKPDGSNIYRALASFVTARRASGQTVPTAFSGSYADVSDGKGGTCGEFFVKRGSLVEYVEPPEGNAVFVTGVGYVAGILGTALASASLQSQVLCNYKAANFGQNGTDHPAPDPTNADYTDGLPQLIYICNTSYTTQDAVNWAARRTFDFACHARKWKVFETALVLVTDPDDTLQIRPRPLRFGDMILIDGSYFVVNACHMQVDATMTGRNQMCVIEAFSIPALDANKEMYRGVLGVWA